ncbi:NuA4 histone H4 acetyltransferase complex and the SWR1 complex subunit [Rhizophlyctis rosea]|nr:NuA4 histone H4 acetyltransferase complex and the SWR1 complex subunit [Rhizophlyctis rosea]
MVRRVVFKLHESFASPVRTVETPPFEVTETGWGEFEILIKVYFQDGGDKYGSLYHTLQLYPKEDATTTQSKRNVVSETYDEVIFNEPTEELFEILQKHPAQPSGKKSAQPLFNAQTEQEELRKIAEAQKKVLDEIEKYRTRVKAEETGGQKNGQEVKMEVDG